MSKLGVIVSKKYVCIYVGCSKCRNILKVCMTLLSKLGVIGRKKQPKKNLSVAFRIICALTHEQKNKKVRATFFLPHKYTPNEIS